MIYDEHFTFLDGGMKKVSLATSGANCSSSLSAGCWYIAFSTVDCHLCEVATSSVAATTASDFFLPAYHESPPLKVKLAKPKISVKRAGTAAGTLYLNKIRTEG